MIDPVVLVGAESTGHKGRLPLKFRSVESENPLPEERKKANRPAKHSSVVHGPSRAPLRRLQGSASLGHGKARQPLPGLNDAAPRRG